MTLVDMSPDMLAVSRRLNPDCDHFEGDMRTVRLGTEFDAVFIHDSIVYMTSVENLRAAVETAFVHTKPGGVALFCPDHTKENFVARTDHGGHDGEDGQAFRYLEWTWDPDPTDDTAITDYAFLIRDADGNARALHDRHTEGLFSEQQWVTLIEGAGFEAAVLPFFHSEEVEGATLFVGKKPS